MRGCCAYRRQLLTWTSTTTPSGLNSLLHLSAARSMGERRWCLESLSSPEAWFVLVRQAHEPLR